MSKQYKSKQNINDLPPYCKVCHDAGKSDYNKHGLKDKNGKTICPYLLSLQCNTCKAFGHTQKHCDKKKQSAQTEDKFCGFCYKVDKNDPAYKTHYVRKIKDDPNSEITCPRLKTTRCNYCHELGHTVISCNKRKLYSAYDNRINNTIEENCDDDDDDDDDDSEETDTETETDSYKTTPRKPTWASRFDSKPKICNAPIPLTRTLTRFGIETKPLPSQSTVVNQTQPQLETETIKTPKKIISWADDSDDE